ncbi:MAG: hypothetical protein RIF33_16040 [Cyclobacteriaceae bacterium]
MKNNNTITIWLGILAAGTILLCGTSSTIASFKQETPLTPEAIEVLKTEALEILDTKCNVCHRKQNPLMIFKEKNMAKRAAKIYKMVFVERRMPKIDGTPLTFEEYATLEKWLFTQNIR